MPAATCTLLLRRLHPTEFASPLVSLTPQKATFKIWILSETPKRREGGLDAFTTASLMENRELFPYYYVLLWPLTQRHVMLLARLAAIDFCHFLHIQNSSGLDVYNRAASFIATMHRDWMNELISREDLNVVIVTHGLTMRLVSRPSHFSPQYIILYIHIYYNILNFY